MKKQPTDQLNLGETKYSTPWYQELLQEIKVWAPLITVLVSILGGIAFFFQYITNLTDRQAKLEGKFEEIHNELDRIRRNEMEKPFYSPK